jgi:hypothetical protein
MPRLLQSDGNLRELAPTWQQEQIERRNIPSERRQTETETRFSRVEPGSA